MMKQFFQIYPAPVTNVTGGEEKSLADVYRYITSSPKAQEATGRYRQLLKEVEEGKATAKEASSYKTQHFDCACFSGTFNRRRDDRLIRHSGLLCLDFDHVGHHDVLCALRTKLVADPHFTTRLAFVSPGGEGLKWVIDIDTQRCGHRTWFKAVANYVAAAYGLEADRQCVNVSRCCFLPYDADCYVHPAVLGTAGGGGEEDLGRPLEYFDPEAWSRAGEGGGTFSPMPTDGHEPADDLDFLVRRLAEQGVCLTEDYHDWILAGFALANDLGQAGRQYFHELSRTSTKYEAGECDRKFDNLLGTHRQGIHLCTLFWMARNRGVDLRRTDSPRTLPPTAGPGTAAATSATSAIPPTGTTPPKEEEIRENAVLEEEMPLGGMAEVALCTGRTFTDQVGDEDWPGFLREVLDSQPDTVSKDKMILGVLNVVSGLMPKNIYTIYDRKVVYTSLYNIIYGGFATRKGDLEACRLLAKPVKDEMRQEYERQKAEYELLKALWEGTPKSKRGRQPEEPVYRSPFIPANSSASAVYRALDANDGWGLMFETEADSLTNMLNIREYGDFTDLLRKAHHHETCSLMRVNEHIHLEVERPRLSVFLTCTGSQLPRLLSPDNVANGLASRFLFYGLPHEQAEFCNVFEGQDRTLEDIFTPLGQRLQVLYHSLSRQGRRLQFVLSDSQQKSFLAMFREMLAGQRDLLGEGFDGYVFRLALEGVRYAMILTALRRLSDRPEADDGLFDEDEQALPCDDRDFRTAMIIVGCLVNHTARVYTVIGQEVCDPFANASARIDPKQRAYWNALPAGREFTTADALKTAKQMGICERTAQRWLKSLSDTYEVLTSVRRGVYLKPGRKED